MDNIGLLFSSITRRYDLLNRVLSLGQDVLWRKYAVKKMRFFRTRRLLDLACGTCDISIAAKRCHRDIQVVGLDLSRAMLLVGRHKIKRKKIGGPVWLLEGDALSLPFKEDSFDVSIVAFGLRNMSERERVIREMVRVTCPAGQVMILEMTLNGDSPLKFFLEWYVKRVIPFVGGRLSSQVAYSHLSDSITTFLSPESLKQLMERLGLEDIKIFRFRFGITYLHVGRKPSANPSAAPLVLPS